jgi:predicted transposase YdaD
MATPHDALFKSFFATPEHAADVLRVALPEAVVRRIDWSSLEASEKPLIDDALRESRTDLLLHARTTSGDALYVHILFEHQSTEDPWMALRMLRYMVGLWERLVADGARTLPPVIPVVLHHSDRGWRVPRRLRDHLAIDDDLRDALARHLPDLEIVVDDLSHLSDEELSTRAHRASVLLILRALRDARSVVDVARWLLDSVALIRAAHAIDRGPQVLLHLIRYLYRVGHIDDPSAFHEAIRITMGDDMKENAMTMEQHALARGEQQGLQKGLRQGLEQGLELGLRRAVQRQAEARFGPLDAASLDRIARASVADLERWLDRVSASSLDELFAD